MIPAGWHRKLVIDLFDVQLGKMLNEKARNGADPQQPYLTNVNVRWGAFALESLNRMSFSPRERQKYSLVNGDLLVCEGGEVGRCAIWKEEVMPCYFQKALHRLRSLGDEVSPVYMRY